VGKTVLGVFHSRDRAEEAIKQIRERGFPDTEISIVAKEDAAGTGKRGSGATMRDENSIATGTTTGAAIGGVAGLLAGAGALAIPGIGPIVAAGPIAGLLSGAVTGGIAGGLVDWGIPEHRGKHFEQKVKEGKILTVIKTQDARSDDAADILKRNGAEDVESHFSS